MPVAFGAGVPVHPADPAPLCIVLLVAVRSELRESRILPVALSGQHVLIGGVHRHYPQQREAQVSLSYFGIDTELMT